MMLIVQNILSFFTQLFTNRVFQNIIFWLFYAVLPLWSNWDDFSSFGNKATDILFYGQVIFASYFNNLFLMPLFFDEKKYALYFGLVILFILIIDYFSLFHLVPLMSDYLNNKDNYLLEYIYSVSDFGPLVLAFAGARVVRNYMTQQRKMQQLKEKQIETELNFLKSQVNPHLLFNTLNMMYAHALDNSPKVPAMILKLSESMRYMLYECNEKQVSLAKELSYIQNFIELQELRLEGRGKVNFTINGDSQQKVIAPMLLIGFVENAFKHAAKNKITGIQIDINVSIKANQLNFEVSNNFEEGDHLLTLEKQGGVGLENVQKRLQLLYPNQHQLSIQQEKEFYKIHLQIMLNEN